MTDKREREGEEKEGDASTGGASTAPRRSRRASGVLRSVVPSSPDGVTCVSSVLERTHLGLGCGLQPGRPIRPSTNLENKDLHFEIKHFKKK